MPGLLLDTTALIDASRGFAPTAGWLARQPLATLHVSSVTVGELFRGARPPADDARIAAIALCHGLTVATSNTRHLAPLCPTIDPRTA